MPYSLSQINAAIRSDPAAFAAECDAAFARKVQCAAEKIAGHRSESRIILLSGPSGSGKTTTALKIGGGAGAAGIFPGADRDYPSAHRPGHRWGDPGGDRGQRHRPAHPGARRTAGTTR